LKKLNFRLYIGSKINGEVAKPPFLRVKMLFEIDIELLRNNNITEKETRAYVLESLLHELIIKYTKEYAMLEDRSMRRLDRKYLDDESSTIILSFDCDESKYKYLMYLFNKKLKSIETIYKSFGQ